MYERILVPLDGSQVGEAALSYIEDLVARLSPTGKVEVTLLQAMPSTHWVVAGEASAPVSYSSKEMSQMQEEVRAYLAKAGERLKRKGATVNVRVSAGNDAADEIIKTAAEINADLIAMSTHGRSGISRWALGSVADRVIRTGATPILVVRAPKGTEQT